MPRRRILVAVVLALVGSTLPSVAGARIRHGSESAQGTLEWDDCGGAAQCADLDVPLDDTMRDGPTISLALVRYRALDPAHRIGSIVINNGGPGQSAVDFVNATAESLPKAIQDRFDIVGFDPRGVGGSDQIDCTSDLDPYYDAEWAPDTASERSDLYARARKLVAQCEATSGDVLPYLSTDRVARDLDRIRAALDDDKLTYLGYSYGTLIGEWYAEQYPERVRALVLDGVLDPSLDSRELQVQQASAFERSLDAALRFCSRSKSCDFHRDGRSKEAYDRLRARIGKRPLAAGDDSEADLNGTRFDLAVVELLYFGKSGWTDLFAALDRADEGDPSDLLFYADLYTGREAENSYDNSQEAFISISCADGPPTGSERQFRSVEDAAAKVAPRLGRAIVNGTLPCAFWPFEPPSPRALPANGAPPILLLATANDPATPLAWAREVHRQMQSSVLVRVHGSRHTSFGEGNRCVDSLVVRYITRRHAPDDGTRC
jgi:pimeloyl-ACP methyl ester carboxylesterase